LSTLIIPYCKLLNHAEWEQYLPFDLFAYCSAVHALIGTTPLEIMFGYAPQQLPFPKATAYDVTSYQS